MELRSNQGVFNRKVLFHRSLLLSLAISKPLSGESFITLRKLNMEILNAGDMEVFFVKYAINLII